MRAWVAVVGRRSGGVSGVRGDGVAGRGGVGVAVPAVHGRGRLGGHGGMAPWWGERVVGAARAAQQRSGRARSRANALASSTAQGQERCRRRIVRRAWRTMRAAVCEQPVAQGLGLGHRERAVQQQRLGPDGEVLGGQDQLEPDGVAAPSVEGEVGKAGGLGGADAVLDAGALTVAQLQPGQVGVGLVGDEDLEAVPVVVAEAQLGAGVGVLAAADHPGARPARCAGRSSRSARTPRRRRGPGRRHRPLGSRPARVGPGSPRGGGRRSACPARTRPGRRAGARPAGCWPRRCRCGPAPAGPGGAGAGRGRGRPARSDRRRRRRGRCRVAAGPPAARRGPGRGPGRPAAGGTRRSACRCLPRPAWRRCGPAPGSRPRPRPAARRRDRRRPPRRGRGHGPGRRAAGPARRGRWRSARSPARRSGSRPPGRTAPAGPAARPGRSGSRRRRPASPPGPAAPPRPDDGAGRLGRQPSALVSPSRSASSRSSAAPAWPTTPVPSVVTSNRDGELVACTRKVPSLSRDCDLQTAAFSLLERAPCVISSIRHPHPMKSRG